MSTSLSTLTTAVNGIAGLLLASPQTTVGYRPQLASLPPALLFNYEGEQTASIESDITDHFVEDNTAIQDQIALRPETITTQGFIGELNNVAPFGLQTAQKLADSLVSIGAYTPGLSITAILAYNEAFYAYQIANSAVTTAVSTWATVSGVGQGEAVIGANGVQSGVLLNLTQTKQQVFFQQFYGYWRSRTLFLVQTPWAVFENMAIKSLRAIQDAETRMITDFEVTFKMIRYASTQTVATAPVFQNAQGQLFYQAQPKVNLGTQTVSPAPGASVLGSITSGLFN